MKKLIVKLIDLLRNAKVSVFHAKDKVDEDRLIDNICKLGSEIFRLLFVLFFWLYKAGCMLLKSINPLIKKVIQWETARNKYPWSFNANIELMGDTVLEKQYAMVLNQLHAPIIERHSIVQGKNYAEIVISSNGLKAGYDKKDVEEIAVRITRKYCEDFLKQIEYETFSTYMNINLYNLIDAHFDTISNTLTISVANNPHGEKEIDHIKQVRRKLDKSNRHYNERATDSADDCKVCIGVRLKELRELFCQLPLKLDFECNARTLFVGSTGTGKSYALLYELYKGVPENTELVFCDYKNSKDFRFMEHMPFYYRGGEGTMAGIKAYYEIFCKAKEAGEEYTDTYHLLCVDEYPSLLHELEMKNKEQAKELKNMIFSVASQGRSYGYGLWLTAQRPDSALFTAGTREQFDSIIALGNLSPEAKRMITNEPSELPSNTYRRGQGVVICQALPEPVEIEIPEIQNMEDWKAAILLKYHKS